MSLTDFLPIFNETTATIRARIDADVNAGLTPDDPRWIDTREGSFFYDITQPIVIEIARLWDALSVEVPAAAFVEFAWGVYLDYHAAVFDLVRKAAVPATGVVLFAGDAGSFVAEGTIVATDAPTAGGDIIEFLTTASGTTGAQLAAPTGLAATPATTGGTLVAGTYFYTATAVNGFGETVGSTVVSAVTTGSTGRVVLDWSDVAGATSYRVYRALASGAAGVRIYDGALSATTDVGGAGGVLGPPTINTTAGVRLPVAAVEVGTGGNVGARAIVSLETPVTGIEFVTNEEAMASGADLESDVALRTRILLEFKGQGAGNFNDYRRWALEVPGIGRVFVRNAGPGEVQVVIMEEDGDAVSPAIITELQDLLDPTVGTADGRAPVGVTVTVDTPVVVGINILAAVNFLDGFSLDGGGGLVATRALIVAAIREYVEALDVGEDVIYQHVLAQFFRVHGVLSVASLTVNGAMIDVPISETGPAQVAQLATVGLS